MPFPHLVLHIPHAGTDIPAAVRNQFIVDDATLWRERLRLTDWYADELFHLPRIPAIVPRTSRLVVDIERYEDDRCEPMAALGQGKIYTHDCDLRPLRRALLPDEVECLLENHYRPWQLKLALDVRQALDRTGRCLLLDCHTFPSIPHPHERDTLTPRPDICLGTDDAHTPLELVQVVREYFESHGLEVDLNHPYRGCIVPGIHRGDPRLQCLMIEVNRRLYIEEPPATAVAFGAEPHAAPRKLPGFARVQQLLRELGGR